VFAAFQRMFLGVGRIAIGLSYQGLQRVKKPKPILRATLAFQRVLESLKHALEA